MTAAWPFGRLEPGRYTLILADPPWKLEARGAPSAKSAEAHYETYPPEECGRRFLVGELAAEDAVLVLWGTGPLFVRQCLVMERWWGFRYVTMGGWDKRRIGPGHVLRSRMEPFAIGRRGRSWQLARDVENLLEEWRADADDMIVECRREHSRKPDAIYALAEALMPFGPACELFARQRWPAPRWEAWGDQVGRFAAGGMG